MKNYFRFVVFALLGLLNTQWASAQNVTIRGNNGSTIAARPKGGSDYDTFFKVGGFATWQHEQLNMVMTVADATNLTPAMQLDNPANNLFVSSDGKLMQIGKGYADYPICYVSISLPKGYRFTSYTIKFTKPYNLTHRLGNNSVTFNGYNETSTFGETDETFGTYKTSKSITSGGTAQIITREEGIGGEMGNVLYFKLQGPSSSRALIQLESAEFFFTSEEEYSPAVRPASEISSAVSAVDIPFATSKVDFGRISNETYNGVSRISYSSANVTDLEGKFVLYEAESTKSGTGVDDIEGSVVDYKAGSISSAGDYFKLGKTGGEQVYYIETPTYVEVSDGTKVPVGYRIVGAEFEYTNSTSAGDNTFYITYTYNGTTYYLNTEGRFTASPVVWEIDDDGYISSNGLYLVWYNNYAITQAEKPGSGEQFEILSNGRIRQKNYTSYYIRFYVQGGTYYGLITNDDYGYYAISADVPAVEVGDFTLKVYDKTGANPITRTDGNGKVTLTGMNNDAVKFGVQGIGLVRATLTLQALDPYLDQMSVVCNDLANSDIKLEQTFTASDFSVSGGEFWFYVPEDTKSVGISFENLQSKYFDDTYTGGSSTHSSRLNFVKSAHYNAFGTSNNNIYTNSSEAANAQLERQKVSIVGTKKFKFNNANDVGTSGGTYREYPFSLEKYAATPNSGNFAAMTYNVTAEDQVDTRYVFTTDETRYNIAPTTATQHRAYAFYEMIVHVQSHTYVPKVKFTKVYNETLYGTGQTDAFYGVEVTAPYTQSGVTKQGYASTKDIFENIERILKTDKVDDFNNTDLPDDANKILYLDFSKLAGIYRVAMGAEDTETGSGMDAYSNTNAKNCLIFLPKGASADNNNVAYMTGAGTFRAANNIILTDKQPFYTPYDIQVGSENYAKYVREITVSKNGKVTSASIIMPFQIEVDSEGKHYNVTISTEGVAGEKETTPAFSIHTMQSENCLTTGSGADYVYFPVLNEDVSVTEPNKPYLVQVLNAPTDDSMSFIITQKGTLLKSTSSMGSDYTFSGETGSGSKESESYTFINHGSYSGKSLNKDGGFFYFSKNMFLRSNDFAYDAPIYIAPFRCYYSTSRAGAKLASFDIFFGEGMGNASTGIQDIDASIDKDAPVYDLQGRMVARAYRDLAGKNLKGGLYVVNGVKIMVK